MRFCPVALLLATQDALRPNRPHDIRERRLTALPWLLAAGRFVELRPAARAELRHLRRQARRDARLVRDRRDAQAERVAHAGAAFLRGGLADAGSGHGWKQAEQQAGHAEQSGANPDHDSLPRAQAPPFDPDDECCSARFEKNCDGHHSFAPLLRTRPMSGAQGDTRMRPLRQSACSAGGPPACCGHDVLAGDRASL